MIRNYFLTAIRNITRRGIFSFINIAGLAIGMACSILILMWVQHEISYDRFHPDHKSIRRLAFRLNVSGETLEAPAAMAPLASELSGTFPEVEDVVRIHKEENVNIGVGREHYIEPLFLLADSSFFTFFGFDLETGDPNTVLKDPFSIVLTREVAEKLFGKINPVGEKIRLNNEHDYTITGIAADPPSNSHIKYGAIASFVTMYESYPPGSMDGWLSLSYYTYIKFNSFYQEGEFFTRLASLFEEKLAEDASEFGLSLEPFLQPVSSIYLNSNLLFELTPPGNKASVYIFLAIAVFIMLLACINFMNLSTARASMRSKEVGVRKVIGASRKDMIKQFIGESLTYTIVALLLAIPMIEIGLPFFNDITGVRLSFLGLANWRILAGLPVLVLIIGVLAGSYPAFILSGYNPTRIINSASGVSSGNSRLRSGLSIFQMVISITLIICTIFVWQQMNYINKKDLGFNKQNKIILQLITGELKDKRNLLEKEMESLPGIKQIAFSNSYPGMIMNGTKYKPEGYDEEILGSYMDIDHKFLSLMNIKLVEGRSFDPSRFSDSTAVLVNETAVRSFGWSDPLERTIDCGQTGTLVPHTVVGVVADFHFQSMHTEVEPLMIHMLRRKPRFVTIDIEPENFTMTLAGIKSKWEEINPDDPFEFKMLSDAYDIYYTDEKRLGSIFIFFSFLAFIIAALGMYGLASFMVENKTKEVGIRKVYGAPVIVIVAGFLKQFGLWLIISNIIAWGLAWFYINNWLDMFAYKISVNNPLVYLISAIISVVVVLLAAGYQSLKAAHIDPARSLKYE